MKKFIIASTVCLAFISSCTSPSNVPTTLPTNPTPTLSSPIVSPTATKVMSVARPQLTFDTLPRISGSTSTQPVTVIWMCNLLGLKYEWLEEATGDSPRSAYPVWDRSDPKSQSNADKFRERLTHSKTHEAYVEVIENRADLILVAREPSADEAKLAQTRGVKLEVQPFAWDALVFLVNEKNPIINLLLVQIQDVYSGKAATWESLGGGSTEKVVPLLRNENSGSHELFKKFVMKDRKIVGEPRDVVLTMMGLVDRVGESPNDLGYSVFYYTQAMVGLSGKITPMPLFSTKPPPIKLIAIDGAMPTKQTIADGAYALREPVYAVVRSDASASTVQLRDWLKSTDGQKIVEESGYVIWK